MDLISLHIKGISFSQTQTGAYALILEEDLGDRKLPVIIGSFEAQSIALALEKDIVPPRPITHDLFANFIKTFNIKLKAVFIYKLEDGVFFSNILFENEDGEEVELDSRTSDAIALAVRFDTPIYTNKDVMDKAGIYLDLKEDEDKTISKTIHDIQNQIEEIVGYENEYINLSEEDLKNLLKEAVQNENYEQAAKLRDELDKRNLK